MNSRTIKTAVFDLGGTLLTPRSGNWYLPEPVQIFLSKHHYPSAEVSRAIYYAKKEIEADVSVASVIEEQQLYQRFYRTMLLHLCAEVPLDTALEFASYRASASEQYQINWEALEVIKPLRGTIRTILFSNTWPSVIDYLRSENVLELFSCALFSCEVGFKKPDARFFDLLQDKACCNADEIVLYDDNERVIDEGLRRGILAKKITYSSLADEIRKDFMEG